METENDEFEEEILEEFEQEEIVRNFLEILQEAGRLNGTLPTSATPAPNPRAEEISNLIRNSLNTRNSTFSRAAVTIRKAIREQRKKGQIHDYLLAVLYDLAAIDSFMNAYPFDIETQLPAYHVREKVAEDQWPQILQYDYQTLGYEKLLLLNATDKSWIKNMWGDPRKHSTLRVLQQKEWSKAAHLVLVDQWTRDLEFLQVLQEGDTNKAELPTFEQYVANGKKRWQEKVEKTEREMLVLPETDRLRINWERFKAANEVEVPKLT